MTVLSARPLHRALLGAALLVLAPTGEAVAQSAQKYALQFSALTTTIKGTGGSGIGGWGVEPQLRFNRLYTSETAGVVSVGVGVQRTSHSSGRDNITITGVFAEPRWVPNTSSPTIFPYLAGRLGVLQQSNNFGSSSSSLAVGAGAGIAVKLSRTVNVDGGLALVNQKFGNIRLSNGQAAEFVRFTTYAAKLGVSVGFPSRAR